MVAVARTREPIPTISVADHQVFRAYNARGSIMGGELVDAGNDQEAVAERLLADPAVAFLHTRNVIHGCYMLMIRRA